MYDDEIHEFFNDREPEKTEAYAPEPPIVSFECLLSSEDREWLAGIHIIEIAPTGN